MLTTSTRTFALLWIVALAASCASRSESSSKTDAAWRTALASAPTNELDGAHFLVELVDPAASATPEKDELEFAGGRFHSTACGPYGFASGVCSTQKSADGVAFDSTCTNTEGDTNAWHGTVHGDSIEGSFTWTPKHGAATTRSFRGTRRR